MKLPKKVYVAVENAGENDEYLSADATIEGLAENEKRRVGIYRLEGVVEVWREMKTKEAKL